MLKSHPRRRITSLEVFLYILREFKNSDRNLIKEDELINKIIRKVREYEIENNTFFDDLPSTVTNYTQRILKEMKKYGIVKILNNFVYINFFNLDVFLKKYECLNSLLQYSPVEVLANLKDLICKYSDCSDVKSSLKDFYYKCGLSLFVSPVKLYHLLNKYSEKNLNEEKIHKELNPDCLVVYAIYLLANEGRGNVISFTSKKIIKLLEKKVFRRGLESRERKILEMTSRRILNEISNEIENSTIYKRDKYMYLYDRKLLEKYIKENYSYSQCLKKYKSS